MMPAVNRRLRRLADHLPSAAPSAAGGWDGPKSGTAPTAPVTVETTVGWPEYLPPPEYVHVFAEVLGQCCSHVELQIEQAGIGVHYLTGQVRP